MFFEREKHFSSVVSVAGFTELSSHPAIASPATETRFSESDNNSNSQPRAQANSLSYNSQESIDRIAKKQVRVLMIIL